MSGPRRARKSLWTCPFCGRAFANRNQSHACGRHDLHSHFEGRSPEIRVLFEAFLAALEECGPVTVLPQKTRIAFQVRMSFAQVTPRRDGLEGHFVLARRIDDPRFLAVESFLPHGAFTLGRVRLRFRPPVSVTRKRYLIDCKVQSGLMYQVNVLPWRR